MKIAIAQCEADKGNINKNIEKIGVDKSKFKLIHSNLFDNVDSTNTYDHNGWRTHPIGNRPSYRIIYIATISITIDLHKAPSSWKGERIFFSRISGPKDLYGW